MSYSQAVAHDCSEKFEPHQIEIAALIVAKGHGIAEA